MKNPRRLYLLAIVAGSGIAFLADYPPFRDALRERFDLIGDELDERRQYNAAVRRTLESIRRLPETGGDR